MAMEEGAPIDWDDAFEASQNGRLMELLVSLPRARWAERDTEDDDDTLLHVACCGPNVEAAVALLQSKLVHVNATDRFGATPAHGAAMWTQPRMMEVLCAAGADLRMSDTPDRSLIDRALDHVHEDDGDTVRVLVANGVRLSTAHARYQRFITSKLWAFERGVLRCRSVVAAMMRVKRVGQLWRWDKFLLREVAYAVWARRYNESWSSF